MKKTVYFLFFIQAFAFGQNTSKIDSLKTGLATVENMEDKIRILQALYDETIFADPKESIEYARKSLRLSEMASNRKLLMQASHSLGSNHMYLGNMDSSFYYHNKTKDLALILKDSSNLAMALSDIANYYGMKGEFEKSFDTYDQAITLFREAGKYTKMGVTIGHLGSIHMDKGNYRIAQIKFMEALKILDTLKTEPYMEADIIRKIGHIQYNLKNYTEAIDYYNRALKVYLETNDNVFASEAYIDIGATYLDQHQNEKAIQNFKEGIAIAEKYHVEGTAAIAYHNLGDAFMQIGDFSQAYEYLSKSLAYHKENGFTNNKIEIQKKMAELYLAQNMPDKSLVYANSAIHIADSVKALDYQQSCYLLRSRIYEKLHHVENSLMDRKTQERFKDSLYNLKKTQQIQELRTLYETEKKEAEIALQEEEINTLNQKAKVDSLTKSLYAGGMASALAFSGLLFFGFRQRMKKNRMAREKQEAIYQQEIAHKKKELASQTLHLVQKNTFIQELKENLEKIRQSPELFKIEFRRLVMLLKKQSAEDKDWEVFKTYFAEVHNDFDQKLKSLYGDISEKEIRLAAFLRMNLTTKEISATMNVMPDSILKSKYRLKKKLGLARETDLTTFLNTL